MAPTNQFLITIIVIIVIIVSYMSIWPVQGQPRRQQQLRQAIRQASIWTEPVKVHYHEEAELHCNLSTLLLTSNHQAQLVANLSKVSWFKNSEQFHRYNGQAFTYDDTHLSLTLKNTGPNDTAKYSSRVSIERQQLYNRLNMTTATYDQYQRKGNETHWHGTCHFDLQVLPSGDEKDMRPVISHPPINQTVAPGSTVTFTCVYFAPATSIVMVYWFRLLDSASQVDKDTFWANFTTIKNHTTDKRMDDKFMLNGAREETLTVHNVSQASVGHYGCHARSTDNLSDARIARLSLLPPVPQSVILTEEPKHNLHIFVPAIGFMFLVITLSVIYLVYTFKKSSFVVGDKLKLNAQSTNHPANQTNSGDAQLPLKDTGVGAVSETCNMSQFTMDCALAHTGHFNHQAHNDGTLNLNKDTPNNTSPPSMLTDLASGWCPSVDTRLLYHQSSNTTMTTVPMYDHPPSTGAISSDHCGIFQPSIIINPFYGQLASGATRRGLFTFDGTYQRRMWSFPRHRLEFDKILGKGDFGEVWKCNAYEDSGNAKVVAVKTLINREGQGTKERQDLLAEIEIMKLLDKHPNVVQMFGCCAEEAQPIYLIMEFVEKGGLISYLRKSRSYNNLHGYADNLTSRDLIRFSYDIAKGMEYVSSQGIIHRDLAARNILVSANNTCKVADFGFARKVDDECAYERKSDDKVPVRWMAPESLDNKYTTKSDVFSFGILMWEIVTLGSTPYSPLSAAEVMKRVRQGERLFRPNHCKKEVYDIMWECWSHEPRDRPKFGELAQKLDKLSVSGDEYIELEKYPDHCYYNILTDLSGEKL